jgi:hypothetical protein
MNELQRTPEWFEQKLGKLSGSRVYDIIPGKRGGYLAARETLMFELLVERITGQRVEKYITPAMQLGIDLEPVAIERYVAHTGRAVGDIGFVPHPTIQNFGASPDGVIGSDGVLEVKCPNSATVLKILAGGEINPAWLYQVQCEMLVSNRDWCDLCMFDPRLPAPLDLTVRRIKRDRLVQQLIEHESKLFNAELAGYEEAIRTRAVEI